MAEQFAQLVSDEGEGWLENKSLEFINQCKTHSAGNNTKYYSCLEMGLKKVTKQLSSSCQELGEEGLWDEDRCARLVSYIFIKDFDTIMQANRPLIEKVTGSKVLNSLFNPIVAIVLLILYVLNIVLLVDPGNWSGTSKFCFVVGAIILGSWFLKSEFRFFGMGGAILICVGGIILSYIKMLFKPDKKQGRYSRR